MALKLMGETCGIEVYGPDEDGIRIICTKVSGCPLNHPGEIGLDCFLNKESHPELTVLDYSVAGSAGRTDAVAGPVATTTQEVRPEGSGPLVETSGHAPDISEVEPRSHFPFIDSVCPICHESLFDSPNHHGTTGGMTYHSDCYIAQEEAHKRRKAEPGAGKTETATVQEGLNVAYVGGKPGPVPDSHINSFPGPHLNKIISHELDRGKLQDNASGSEKTFSKNLSPPDSHMVVVDDEKWWLKDLHEKRDALSSEQWQQLVRGLQDYIDEQYEKARSATPVLDSDDTRSIIIQSYVDKLNEISMEMYLESKSSGPPPIPTLGPREMEEFLKKLDEFKLTPEQQEFYRDARRRFPPEWHPDVPGFSSLSHWEPEVYDGMMRRQNRRLKHRKRHTAQRTGGMIRMPGNKPEPPEPEEESLFEVDDEMHGPVLPKVKAEPELQKPVPKAEKPDEVDEEEDEEEAHGDLRPVQEEDEEVEGIEFLIDDMETAGLGGLGGYVLDLEIHTDDDGDHVAVMTLDNVTIEIMLGDFIEIVEALERMLPRMREIQSS